jgi:hypothetical protein
MGYPFSKSPFRYDVCIVFSEIIGGPLEDTNVYP